MAGQIAVVFKFGVNLKMVHSNKNRNVDGGCLLCVVSEIKTREYERLRAAECSMYAGVLRPEYMRACLRGPQFVVRGSRVSLVRKIVGFCAAVPALSANQMIAVPRVLHTWLSSSRIFHQSCVHNILHLFYFLY